MATVQCGSVVFEGVQAIFFDKDGTLADSQAFLRHLGQRRARIVDAQIPGVGDPLLMAFGVDRDRLNPAGLLAVGTRRENEIAAAAYVAETGRDWIEALAIVERAFTEVDQVLGHKADQTPPFPGVVETLQQLTSAGLILGLLSSDTTAHVNDFVARYELTPIFQMSLGSDGGLAKPDPAFLERACHTLNVLPSDVLMVGDSLADLQMAKAAGARGAIALSWDTPTTQLKAYADAWVDRIEQIRINP